MVAIEKLLDRAEVRCPRLLPGEAATAWPMVALARERGCATRIGLEDTLSFADGRPATSNAALVAEAVKLFGVAR